MDGNGQKTRDFEEEALIHMNALYNMALRMTRNEKDAEDLVQETFFRAYRFFDRFERGSNCKAWLFKIMKNTYINRYKKKSKEPSMVDYQDIEPFYDFVKNQTGIDYNNPEEDVFHGLLDDEVQKALSSLPDDFKMVVLLADIEGLSYKEIAEVIGSPVGTVMSRLYRGRRQLQKTLLDYAQKLGYGKEKMDDGESV
jgi:RNA polymerase sigma-70 factor (ECF subfamily)